MGCRPSSAPSDLPWEAAPQCCPAGARSWAAHSHQQPEKLILSVKLSLCVSCLAALHPSASLLAAGTGSGQPSPGRHQPPRRGPPPAGRGSAWGWGGQEHDGLQTLLGEPQGMSPSLVASRPQQLWLLAFSCAALRQRRRPRHGPGCISRLSRVLLSPPCRAAGSPGRAGGCVVPARFLHGSCTVPALGVESRWGRAGAGLWGFAGFRQQGGSVPMVRVAFMGVQK